MTLMEFSLLAEEEQVEELYNNGVFVGKLIVNNKTTMLYQLNTFYVEVTFKVYRYYISEIKCYTSMDKLMPYLYQVEIDNFIQSNV